MDFELKPIKKLIIIAFALHIIGLCVTAIIYILQIPLRHFVFGVHVISEGETFVFPHPTLIALAAVIFILHCGLTIGFLKAVGGESNLNLLRIISILSFIFVLAVLPILTWGNLEALLVWRNLTTRACSH